MNNLNGNPTPNPGTWHPHLPGVTTAWLAEANGVSARTIHRWRLRANPAEADVSTMTAQLGHTMAILRKPGSMLPLWSRMAIAELAWGGASYTELARQFRCGESTVWRCVKGWSGGFAPLSGQRLLTRQQLGPPPHRSPIISITPNSSYVESEHAPSSSGVFQQNRPNFGHYTETNTMVAAAAAFRRPSPPS